MGLKQGSRAARLVKLIGLLGLVTLAASGCTADTAWHFGWPQAITPQGDAMRQFWMWAALGSLLVGVIVWGLMLWAVAFHRKKKDSDELPRQFQYNLSLDAITVIVPCVIIAVLFYFTIVTQDYVLKMVPNPDVKVNVVAFQWNWDFDYQNHKATNGEDVQTVGSSQEIPLLVLPQNEVIEYDLRSTDVIHSFFVPAFNFKRDVFPDPTKNNQDYAFQNTITQTGSFVGRCAELCGTYHSMMNFEVRVLPKDLFNQYMSLREQNDPQTNQPYTAAAALTKVGQDNPSCAALCTPYAVTTHPFDTNRTLRSGS